MHKRAHAVVQPQPPQDSSERHSRHWVDGAVHCCPASLVADVRAVMRLLPLFACLPFFWALFDQQVCERVVLHYVTDCPRSEQPGALLWAVDHHDAARVSQSLVASLNCVFIWRHVCAHCVNRDGSFAVTPSVVLLSRCCHLQFSTWVFLAKKMNLSGLQTEQLGVLNPM